MKETKWTFLTAQAIAREIPMFPLVASTRVPPSRRPPFLSASSTIMAAGRSFTDPEGFDLSSFAYKEKARPSFSMMFPRRMRGVPPIASRTFFLTAMRKGYSKGRDPSPNSPPFLAFLSQRGGSLIENPIINKGIARFHDSPRKDRPGRRGVLPGFPCWLREFSQQERNAPRRLLRKSGEGEE